MTWLKSICPITLHQANDLPYIVFDDEVILCTNNAYEEKRPVLSDHLITFRVHRNDLVKQASGYYRFKTFPARIRISDIIELDDFIRQGNFIRLTNKVAEEFSLSSKSIMIFRDRYLRKAASEDERQDFLDSLGNYDHCFMLVGDAICPAARGLEDQVTTIRISDAGRVALSIAHEICPLPTREVNWSRSLPELEITFFGFKKPETMQRIARHLDLMKVAVYTIWAG